MNQRLQICKLIRYIFLKKSNEDNFSSLYDNSKSKSEESFFKILKENQIKLALDFKKLPENIYSSKSNFFFQ